MQTPSKTTLALGVAGTIVVVAAVAFVWLRDDGNGDEADVDAENRRAIVSAFSTGVAALDADANERARQELTRATRLAPEEPACWLNLGLAEIRLGNDEAAFAALEKARTLAPEWAAPDRLFGLLESRRGRPEEAIKHLRRAVEKEPDDVQSLFALAEELERLGRDSDQAEIRRLIAEILKQTPGNVAVLMDQARLAVKAEDRDTLRDVVSQLEPLADGWPERTQKMFQQLRDSADAGDLRQSVTRVAFLRNVLLAEPAFRDDLAEVRLPVGVVGTPVQQFQKLPVATPTASPPDTELSFAVESLTDSDGRFSTLVAIPPVDTGDADVFVANGSEIRRAGRDDVALPFPGGDENVPPGPGGLLAVDWNADSAVDLVAAGAGGVRLFRRDANGSFVDATEATALDRDVVEQPALGVWAIDIELDGDLDLLIGWHEKDASVLQNNGDGTFAPIQPFSSLGSIRDAVWSDLNRDGLPDVSLLGDAGKLHVFINERSGHYRPVSVPENGDAILALTTGDVDTDGRLDLVSLAANGAVVRHSLEADGSTWQSVEIAMHDDRPNGDHELFLADLDNNGGLDLAVSSGGETHLWLADPSGSLQALDSRVDVRACAALDLNGDGRLDLAGMLADGNPVRAVNRGTKPYHWQALRPRAARNLGDGRINSFGVGGEMELRSGLLVQKQVISGPTVHFGLGEFSQADVVRVVWPNGTVQAEFDLQADQVAKAEQRLKGSCPFVFAHDGTAMRFVTDFLWRSPLGLRINAQDTAGVSQTSDWIRIDGDQLAARDGYYEVRITAELWETHYFDHVSLMIVDHPAETDVFIDERFARTPPALTLHPTGRLYAITARDDNGDDVTEIVRTADGRYLDTFGRGAYQGVTRDHWVEVEIGDDVPRSDGLRLIARGWVHPTDSSINVALSQGSHAPPRGLSLAVPSEDGEWTVVRSDLGFPAGKDKTIVIDLDGLFSPGSPRRFRLSTNLEVFWDRLAVAFAADPDRLQTRTIAPAKADLRHRGYSRITQANPGSPELPHYNQLIGTAPRWNDLEGYYTRFGDVRELLARTDDRYVIANAGDELVLRFPAPAGPAEGLARDFVLVGDGWNKDGDYNTAFSGTVLPLPSHASAAYDTPPGELADDPVYQRHADDWQIYHTRYVAPTYFREGLRPVAGGR